MGRLYVSTNSHPSTSIMDGVFYNGVLDGIGVNYNMVTNKFLLGEHSGTQIKDNRLEKGFGFPLKEILDIRKEFHLRSIYYYNEIAMLNIKVKLETQMNSIVSKKSHQGQLLGTRNHSRTPFRK